MPEKVAVYCRVSTGSKEQEYSFERQKEYFENYVKTHKEYELYDIYADEGRSGTSLKRAEFERMLEDAGLELHKVGGKVKGIDADGNPIESYKINYHPAITGKQPKFKYIIVKDTSRFARNVMITEVIEQLSRLKVYVVFLDINKSTENDTDAYVISLLQAIDENYSRDNSRKLLKANIVSREKQILRSNTQLFGYTYHKKDKNHDNNYLTINPTEAYIVQLFFRLYYGCFYISPYDLNPSTIPTMQPCNFECGSCSEKVGIGLGFRLIRVIFNDILGFRTRAGKPFAQSTLKHIFENEKYCGYLNNGKWNHGVVFNYYSTPKLRDDYELHYRPDLIPPIISKELFDLATSKRKEKAEVCKPEQRGSPSPYKGKFYCGECGSVMTHNIGHDGAGLYNCRVKKTQGRHHCDNGNVYESQIVEMIKGYCETELSNILQNSTLTLISILYNRIDEKLKQIESKDPIRIAELGKDLETKTQTLTNLYILQANPTTNQAAISASIAAIEAEIKEKQAEYDRLTKKPQILLKESAELLKLCYNALDVLKSQQKQFTEEELWEYIAFFKVYSKVKAIRGSRYTTPEVSFVPTLKTENLLATQYGIDLNEGLLVSPIIFNLGFEEKKFYEQAKPKIDGLAERLKSAEKPYFSSMD